MGRPITGFRDGGVALPAYLRQYRPSSSFQLSAGDVSDPSQVQCAGTSGPGLNAGVVNCSVMVKSSPSKLQTRAKHACAVRILSKHRRVTAAAQTPRTCCLKNPLQSSEPACMHVRNIGRQQFCMTGFRLQDPARCLVSAVEAAERQSMPLEQQECVVTVQTAHHALHALPYAIHGANSSRSHSGKRQASRLRNKARPAPIRRIWSLRGSDLRRTVMPMPEIRQQCPRFQLAADERAGEVDVRLEGRLRADPLECLDELRRRYAVCLVQSAEDNVVH
jgi:hypothetical protein